MRGAVLVSDEGQKLYLSIPAIQQNPETEFNHSVDYWATVLKCDLWKGTLFSDRVDIYDWVLVNLNSCMWDLVVELKEKLPDLKVIGLYEGSLDSICYYSTEEKRKFIRAIRAIDCLGSLVEQGNSFHSLFTDKPVKWLGVPFPVEFVKSFRKSLEEKALSKKIAMGSALNHKNTITSLLATFKALPNYISVLQSFDSKDNDFTKLLVPQVKIHNPLTWVDYLEKYSDSFMCLSLCNRYTWGRVNLDMAALGIPVIGTAGCEVQEHLFPLTTVKDPFKDMDNVIYLIKKLDSDLDFYSKIVDIAKSKLNRYGMKAAIDRFNSVLFDLF